LPDTYFVTGTALRKAFGGTVYRWKKYGRRKLIAAVPPVWFRKIPLWRIDDIGQRYPKLVAHLQPIGSEWLDRFKLRQRAERTAYLAPKQSSSKPEAA
jgi:hypothetical protein